MADKKVDEKKEVQKMQPNHVMQNWRAYLEKEALSAAVWRSKWGFLIPYYKERYKGSRRMPETMRPVKEAELAEDLRSVKPFPKATSAEVGWLSTRKEFQLEVHGSYYTHIPWKAPETWADVED